MDAQADEKEYRIPGVLLVFGFALLLLQAHFLDPAVGLVTHFVSNAVGLAFGVALATFGCFLVAPLLGTSFGHLHSAILKLAGIFTFTAALAGLAGGFGWLVSFPLYFVLLMWLFTLDLFEAFVYAVVLWLARWIAAVCLILAFAD